MLERDVVSKRYIKTKISLFQSESDALRINRKEERKIFHLKAQKNQDYIIYLISHWPECFVLFLGLAQHKSQNMGQEPSMVIELFLINTFT